MFCCSSAHIYNLELSLYKERWGNVNDYIYKKYSSQCPACPDGAQVVNFWYRDIDQYTDQLAIASPFTQVFTGTPLAMEVSQCILLHAGATSPCDVTSTCIEFPPPSPILVKLAGG